MPRIKLEAVDTENEAEAAVAKAMQQALNGMFDAADLHGIEPCAVVQSLMEILIETSIKNGHAACTGKTCLVGMRDCVTAMLDKGENPTDIETPEGVTIMSGKFQ